MKRIVYGFWFVAVCASFAVFAQQPTTEQQLAIQQQMIQRANACVDAYRERDVYAGALQAARQEIETLKAQLAKTDKPKDK